MSEHFSSVHVALRVCGQSWEDEKCSVVMSITDGPLASACQPPRETAMCGAWQQVSDYPVGPVGLAMLRCVA